MTILRRRVGRGRERACLGVDLVDAQESLATVGQDLVVGQRFDHGQPGAVRAFCRIPIEPRVTTLHHQDVGVLLHKRFVEFLRTHTARGAAATTELVVVEREGKAYILTKAPRGQDRIPQVTMRGNNGNLIAMPSKQCVRPLHVVLGSRIAEIHEQKAVRSMVEDEISARAGRRSAAEPGFSANRSGPK